MKDIEQRSYSRTSGPEQGETRQYGKKFRKDGWKDQRKSGGKKKSPETDADANKRKESAAAKGNRYGRLNRTDRINKVE